MCYTYSCKRGEWELNEKIWKRLCKKYNKHCYFSEVENLTVEEAEKYIQNLKVANDFGR